MFPIGNNMIIMERDREATEKRLLETIGKMIAEQGFEHLGINAVAAQSGVSKILIYRYFGSLDGLIAAYIRQHDFWLASSFDFSNAESIVPAVKEMFRRHIERLQTDPVLRKLYRWELSSDNEMVRELRDQREKVGLALIKQVCKRTGRPQQEIAALSSLVIASVTYLAMLGDYCPVYNGIKIGEESGWEKMYRELEKLVDKVFSD